MHSGTNRTLDHGRTGGGELPIDSMAMVFFGKARKICFPGQSVVRSRMCYGLSTSRWSTQPPRKKRWLTMVWNSKKMAPTRMANNKNFTNPNQGDGSAAGSAGFGLVVIGSLSSVCRQQRSTTQFFDLRLSLTPAVSNTFLRDASPGKSWNWYSSLRPSFLQLSPGEYPLPGLLTALWRFSRTR